MEHPQLSESSLEDLCIAVMKLQTDDPLKNQLQLQPKDVLKDWILAQIPAPIGTGRLTGVIKGEER